MAQTAYDGGLLGEGDVKEDMHAVADEVGAGDDGDPLAGQH